MRNFVTYFFTVLMLTAASFLYVVSAQKKVSSKDVTVNKPSAIYLPSSVEQEVLDEINIARTEPQKYVKYLEDYRKQFKGSIVFLPSLSQVQTNEGTAAVDEAIEYLKQVSKLAPYKFSDGLNGTARLQLTDLMENDRLGHRGKNGSDLSARMARFGRFGTINAENISYYAQDPRQIVLMMIVDDGVKSRSHRKNIFSPNLKVLGIAYGKGNVGQGLCVVDFADSFTDGKSKTGVRSF